MHASIWKFTGDPEQLGPCYDAMVDALEPTNFALHLCLRAPDGLVIVDTCPNEAAFQDFVTAEWFRPLLAEHGLPYPDAIDDYPVRFAVRSGEIIVRPGQPA